MQVNHERWTDRLSDYLDGELPPTERAEVRRHLGGCPACAAVLEELRVVVARAADLGELPPSRDLWPDVAARLGAPTRTSLTRPGLSAPQPATGRAAPVHPRPARAWFPASARLAAAALVVSTLSGAALWMALVQPGRAPTAAGMDPPDPSGQVAGSWAAAGFDRFDATIDDLQQALTGSRDRLEPSTVQVVDVNLAILDAAIDEARRALVEDPDSPYLNQHLAETMRRKLQLLRDVGALAAEAL